MTECLRRAAQIADNVMSYFDSDDEEFASNLRADICGAMAYAEQAEREACVRIALASFKDPMETGGVFANITSKKIHDAIRARGQGQAGAAAAE